MCAEKNCAFPTRHPACGQLTEVWVPDEAHEAMRDLVRLRAQAMKDQRKTRQQPMSFLLRHGQSYNGTHWNKAHRRRLGELKFTHAAQHLALEELLARIEWAEDLCDPSGAGDRRAGAVLDIGAGGRGSPGSSARVRKPDRQSVAPSQGAP